MRFVYFVIYLYAAAVFSSCASPAAARQIPVNNNPYPMPASNLSVMRQDVRHIVSPGESLWRISKMYDVKMQDVMRANNINNLNSLKMGQELLIPQAAGKRNVDVPLYHSQKWVYIIIHHSATDGGNALSLFNIHIKRGFDKGLGYHFIIDNGTDQKDDGQIEISPRWIRQENGAHCKADGMNYKGIGICLVGNFSRERVSERQMASLVYLVNILRKHYRIPVKNIIGHGKVRGARTECPGNKFPWDEFIDKTGQ